ncbi:SUN domain-containing protein 1-like [Typha angustifolia]|uniref:SUN domain-containing protein 1-like n=1 Tax=Typha angustifolia TaxID=59011 RepID=UPI003C2B4A4B
MSASTAAIPSSAANANPSLSLDSNSRQDIRRRTIPVVKKKSDAEMLMENRINGVCDDKVVVSGKDLSLERPKDSSEVKKDLVASAVASRRKKGMLKPEKPKWQIVLSVLAKTCVLVMVVWWTSQLIWRWKDGKGPFAVLDTEGRLSDVEASLKKTAKMLQVQLEIVDKKIGNEIAKVKNDLVKQVDDKDAFLQVEMKKLEDRTLNLDKSLAEFVEMGFISKKEFMDFLNDLKKSKGLDNSVNDLSLDDIKSFAKEIVEREIEKHAADGLGMVDYALASGGAKVVSHSEPYTYGKASKWFSSAKGRSGVHTNSQKMLEPSFGEPGQCFAMKGSEGFVEIKLRTAIIPEAVTLEHVSKSVAYDRSSAPKHCRVSAWHQGPDDAPSGQPEKMHILTEFFYDLEKSNAQTFSVDATDSRIINMIRLDFFSNHGSSSHTCIYRFRVHGYEPSSF